MCCIFYSMYSSKQQIQLNNVNGHQSVVFVVNIEHKIIYNIQQTNLEILSISLNLNYLIAWQSV